MERRHGWLALLWITVLLFSSSEAQQRRRNSNQPAKTAGSSTAYDAYVGQYLLPGGEPRGDVITITKSGNRLIAECYFKTENAFELLPEAEDKFVHKLTDDYKLSFTFVKDANGRVPQLIFTKGYPDRRIAETANRISSLIPYTPSPPKLSEYVGKYQVRSGGPINEYIVEDGVLYVFDRGMARNGVVEKLGLFPDSEDRFLMKIKHTTITFLRDERGKVTQVEVVKSPTSKFVAYRL
jgi:hypothetical protein